VTAPAAVLFDLDGVLIDSRVAIGNSINHALAAVGRPIRPLEELERWIGPPLLDSFAELASPEEAEACLAAYRERYSAASLVETTAVPGMGAALARVAAAVPVAVATSKPAAYAVPLCEQLGFIKHLQAVEGPDLAAPREVKADTVARALTALGHRPGDRVPLVGDRSQDVAGARAHGLPCVGVLWGYGSEAELRAAGADPIVAVPTALPAALGL
jgi:phosphoglycolate phosphatase